MDDKWFKTQQKIAGVTPEEIAEKLGKHFSLISRIYVGRQKMTAEQAQVFADMLKVPLSEVMKRAGILHAEEAQSIDPGFSESDVTPWIGKKEDQRTMRETSATLGGNRPGVDVWKVTTNALVLSGYLKDDHILLDTHLADRAKAGDIVIAQIYDWNAGTAVTVLRRFEPPVLVASSINPEDQRVHIVDGTNVVIMGKIISSWRTAK